MLEVKTYIDKSTIPGAGFGCFTDQFIKKGKVIWRFNPFFDRIYTDDNMLLMSNLEIDFINTYAYMHNGLYFLCIDNGRFFNHSYEPNTIDPSNEYVTYASRDILRGEEILSDYRNFGISEIDNKFNMNDLPEIK